MELPPSENGTSVLATIAATVGPVPRVLLRDTDGGDEPPLVKPRSNEMPPRPDPASRYQLLGEIARGGMGAVLKGRDTDLGRDLAVKILLEQHRDQPHLVRRFVEEAQIGGQLQHPGIVPVYELGTFADQRPFFTMKLVKGRTLADLLDGRPDPTSELPRFLGIFEQICQTLAYAHARGVIHRDLKPSNVMVGSFGEVQVMDWGLAKVLDTGGISDDERTIKRSVQSVIETVRSGSDVDLSVAGSIMGTPAYMAPEQARGEIDDLDERADVFGLGAMLCEILTGQPPYVDRSVREVQKMAAAAELEGAFRRIDASGADAEVIALVRHCLAVEKRHRPREAGEVAAALTSYFHGAQEKLKQAELAKVEAQAKAVEERKRRKLQVGLAAAVLGLVVFGGGSGVWMVQERQRQTARIALLTREADVLRKQAFEHAEEPARWLAALEAVKRIEVALAGLNDSRTHRAVGALRAEVQAGMDAAEADRTLMEALADIRSARADDQDGSTTDAAYADAFRSADIDVDGLDPADAGARIRKKPARVARALVAALDHWTAVRRERGAKGSEWARLVAACRAADPDPARDGLRAAILIRDEPQRRERLRPLVTRADVSEWSPASLLLLAEALAGSGDIDGGVAVLRRASGMYPDDAWVHYDLGGMLERVRPAQPEEAIRAYSVARALQPTMAHEMAHALEKHGRNDEAEAVFRDLVRRRPHVARHLMCLGLHLENFGKTDEAMSFLDRAVAEYRAALRLKPDDSMAYNNLGMILHDKKADFAAAEIAFREAIRLRPDHEYSHLNLGNALASQKKYDEAVAAYREAIRLKPGNVRVRTQLALTLSSQGKHDEAVAELREAIRLDPGQAGLRRDLGVMLYNDKQDYAAAEMELKEAIRLDPSSLEGRDNLASVLKQQNKLEELITESRAMIRLDPGYADAYVYLGYALCRQGKLDEAMTQYRTAIRLTPDYAEAHNYLGVILCDDNRAYAAAEAEFRTAIRLKPDYSEAHHNLAIALTAMGRHDEAIAELRKAVELKPDYVAASLRLGLALYAQGKHDEAISVYRASLRLKPDGVFTHYNLGNAFFAQGKDLEASVEYREAIRLKPDLAEAHCNLGHTLRRTLHYDEALDELRRGHELGSKQPGWRYPSAEWVRQCEQMREFHSRLPAILKGTEKPRDAAEGLIFAQMCKDQALFVASARLWADVFRADPSLAEDRPAKNRYNAACYAMLAASGKSKDDPPPDEIARINLRSQTLDWLRAELVVWTRLLDAGASKPDDRALIQETLRHWQTDSDLSAIRDPAALARLPEAERKAWESLWVDVAALLKRAETP
jgi:serine/threonine-protein kinase